MNGISALIRRDMRASSLSALCHVRVQRQLFANQKVSSHQTLDLPAP